MKHRFALSAFKITAVLFLSSCGKYALDTTIIIPNAIPYEKLIYSHSDYGFNCNVQVFELEKSFTKKIDDLGIDYLNQNSRVNSNQPPFLKKGDIVYEPWRLADRQDDLEGNTNRSNRRDFVAECLKNADPAIFRSFFNLNGEKSAAASYFTFSENGKYPGASELNLLHISSNGFMMVSAYGLGTINIEVEDNESR